MKYVQSLAQILRRSSSGQSGRLVDLIMMIMMMMMMMITIRLFQKVDQWMNKDEQMDSEARKKLDDANQVDLRLW